jgi:hypothetical protein
MEDKVLTLPVLYARHGYSKWNKYCDEHPGSDNTQIPLEKFIDPSITKKRGQEGSKCLGENLFKLWESSLQNSILPNGISRPKTLILSLSTVNSDPDQISKAHNTSFPEQTSTRDM